MIHGMVNVSLEATLRLHVVGPNGPGQEVTAIIDTGYNGPLSLPLSMVTVLALQPSASRMVTLGDASQRLGALGTLVAYALLLLLARYAWLNRGAVFARAGPLLYPLLFMLVAYSLSVGNAGTGFRYRSHLVTLAIAAMVILREHARMARSPARAREQPGLDLLRTSVAPRLPVSTSARGLPARR